MLRKSMNGAIGAGASVWLLTVMISVFPLWGVPSKPAEEPRVSPGTPHSDTRLIVDTDMGLDDARALFVLAGAPGVDLEIVMTVEGSASAGKAADNAIGLLETAGLAGVQVLRGRSYPALDPPPWRATAESLAGCSFPPPRVLTQASLDKDAHSRTANALPDATVLALGPLGNIARIELLHPGTLRKTRVIIPARCNGTAIEGWNLERDPEAAAAVLEKAGEVVLVDVDAPVDDRHILCDLVGDTPAVRWILGTVCKGDGAHAFLHDEIAAAAVASPGLFESGPERYSAALREGELTLSPDPDGNVRIARLRDTGAFEAFIHACWETPGPPARGHAPATGDRR